VQVADDEAVVRGVRAGGWGPRLFGHRGIPRGYVLDRIARSRLILPSRALRLGSEHPDFGGLPCQLAESRLRSPGFMRERK
jgi:hypothetical protein